MATPSEPETSTTDEAEVIGRPRPSPSRNTDTLHKWLPHFTSGLAVAIAVWSALQTSGEQALARAERELSRKERVADLLDDARDMFLPFDEDLHMPSADPVTLERAEQKIDKALLLDPASASAYRYRAMCHLLRRQFKLAEADAKEAIRLDPASVEAYNDLAQIYHAAHDISRSIAAYEEALSIQPDSSAALTGLGGVQLRHGDPNIAASLLTKAADLPDAGVRTFHEQAIALSMTGHHEEAVAAATRAASLEPANFLLLDTLAWCLAAAGRRDDAVAAFKRIAQVDPAREQYANGIVTALRNNPGGRILWRRGSTDHLSALLEPNNLDN
ncbi:MAG TPA: tetratricopeptide repeat protein [Thermoanaerobaculia bacterium]|jgi:tetratricopeptide (TPR) repeat protein